MDKKLEFNEALAALVEYAAVNGNIVTKAIVQEYFKDILDNEAMYEPIFKYLSENKITVSDYTPKNDSKSTSVNEEENSSEFIPKPAEDTEKAHMFMDMFAEDVNGLTIPSDDELAILTKNAVNNDKSSIDRLTEAFLGKVIKIAEEFESFGIKKSDLISEGNLGLYEAVLNLDSIPKDINLHFENAIRHSMEEAVQKEIGVLRIANHITQKANSVSDATTALAEKLGREATIEELCEYLSLPEEQVREILKISLDAVNIVSE